MTRTSFSSHKALRTYLQKKTGLLLLSRVFIFKFLGFIMALNKLSLLIVIIASCAIGICQSTSRRPYCPPVRSRGVVKMKRRFEFLWTPREESSGKMKMKIWRKVWKHIVHVRVRVCEGVICTTLVQGGVQCTPERRQTTWRMNKFTNIFQSIEPQKKS